MTFFFLVVGLEAKRELDLGELRERRRLAIPAFAAIGGMALPIAIYHGVQRRRSRRARLGRRDVDRHRLRARRAGAADAAPGDPHAGLPAHAGGRRRPLRPARDRRQSTPTRSRSARLPWRWGSSRVLLALRYAPLAWRRPLSVVAALGLWVAMFESGVDPVISGLAIGLATSAYPPSRDDLERATALARHVPRAADARARALGAARRPVGDLAQRAAPVRAAPVDELRRRAAVRARQRRRPDRAAGCSPTPPARRSRSGSSSATSSASRSASSPPRGSCPRPALNGPRSPLSGPVLLAGGAVAGIGLHGLAADLDARPSAGRRSTRRSSAPSARSSSRRSSPG